MEGHLACEISHGSQKAVIIALVTGASGEKGTKMVSESRETSLKTHLLFGILTSNVEDHDAVTQITD